MTKKLKTLKDIDSYADSQEIPQSLLEEWAREWIEELEKYSTTHDDHSLAPLPSHVKDFYYGDSEWLGDYCENLTKWIKHFFNIE